MPAGCFNSRLPWHEEHYHGEALGFQSLKTCYREQQRIDMIRRACLQDCVPEFIDMNALLTPVHEYFYLEAMYPTNITKDRETRRSYLGLWVVFTFSHPHMQTLVSALKG